MSGRLPRINEIEDVQRAIRATNFPRLVMFTDMVNRYVDIKLRGKVNWLRISVLLWLIIRGGSITPSELARRLVRSNHSMTRLIDSLEEDGLVIRERSVEDRRTVHVKVTSDGLAFTRQSLNNASFVEVEVMSCLDKNEVETLNNLIRMLRLRLIEKTSKRMDAWAYYHRGITCKSLGKKAEAVADLEMCVNLSRDRSLTKAARRELEELRDQ